VLTERLQARDAADAGTSEDSAAAAQPEPTDKDSPAPDPSMQPTRAANRNEQRAALCHHAKSSIRSPHLTHLVSNHAGLPGIRDAGSAPADRPGSWKESHMSQVTATRSELLARRSREGIARRGHTLTQKRAALIGELRRAGLEAGDKRAELERAAAAARRALSQAHGGGRPAGGSLRTGRGYALLTSTATIDLVAESFEAELDALFALAEFS
jgi:hypothetical protein